MFFAATKVSYAGTDREASWIYAYANACEAKSALKCGPSPPGLSSVTVTSKPKLPAKCKRKFEKYLDSYFMGAACFSYCPGYLRDAYDEP